MAEPELSQQGLIIAKWTLYRSGERHRLLICYTNILGSSPRGSSSLVPVDQQAESEDLKSSKSGFESQ